MKVSVTCTPCGNLYRSSDIKGTKHHENARAKAETIARAHSDAEPDHVVEVDPGWGDAAEMCGHGQLAATCTECADAAFARVK